MNHEDWRGMRFSTLERAQRELKRAVPPERFYILDRETKQKISE